MFPSAHQITFPFDQYSFNLKLCFIIKSTNVEYILVLVSCLSGYQTMKWPLTHNTVITELLYRTDAILGWRSDWVICSIVHLSCHFTLKNNNRNKWVDPLHEFRVGLFLYSISSMETRLGHNTQDVNTWYLSLVLNAETHPACYIFLLWTVSLNIPYSFFYLYTTSILLLLWNS